MIPSVELGVFMLKNFLVGIGLIALLGTAALAQTATPPVDPAAKPALSVDDQTADNDQQEGGWFNRKHHGHRMHGGEGMRGPHGGMMMGKGFALMLGNGQGLRINCGDEPLKQCIESAQPVIDALNKANPGQTPVVAPKAP
jgi:opacity protein-like surface antigen